MTLEEHSIALADYIQAVTGRETIFAGDNGPQPSTPYFSIDISTARMLKYDIETEEDREGELYSIMRGLCHVEYSVEGWDGTPVAGLLKYASSLNSAYFQDKMPDFGLSEQSAVTEIMNPIIGSRIQTMSKMSSWFYIAISEEFPIDHWDHNEVVVNNAQTGYSITIEIPPENEDCQ